MGLEARNRRIPDWLTRVRTGQLVLPRFQRFESWSHSEVSRSLTRCCVADRLEPHWCLQSETQNLHQSSCGGGTPTDRMYSGHLLDGQQRLTPCGRP